MKSLSYLIYDEVRKAPLTQVVNCTENSAFPLAFTHFSTHTSLNALIGNHLHPQIEELVGRIVLSGGRSGRA